LKIVLLHDSVLPARHYGGIERVVMNLAHELTAVGHQVVLACRAQSQVSPYEHVVLPRNYLELAPETYLPKDVDFLHLHQPLRVRPKIPYLVTIHGNAQPGESYWPNSCFLSRSHAANHNSSVFVYNGINVSDYPFVAQKENYFAFLARAKWRVKNLKTCLDLSKDIDVRLEVMGGSGLSTSRVRYHGSIGEDQGKLEILSRATALLYPTNWPEPFGMALVEAMACGTPVIASANGAMPEIVSPATGVICKSYDEFVLAAKQISTLVRVEDCRAHVEKNFSSRAMAENYLKLYEEIVRVGEFKQSPRYAHRPESVQLLYKPTLLNRLKLKLLRKI